ncbi:MAG: YCF48-related protein [Gammaproteobacteria bacterium]
MYIQTLMLRIGVAAVFATSLLIAAHAAVVDPGVLPAEQATLASRSLLLDIAQAGSRLVVVGERGHVLLSDNRAQTWRQARSVPTQDLLTGVCFSDERHGVAVGHDEVVLITADGGETWSRQHYSPEAQQPLLDVLCNGNEAIAVGAYGTYLVSSDSGATWAERKFEAKKRQGLQPGAQKVPGAKDSGTQKSGAHQPNEPGSSTARVAGPPLVQAPTHDADEYLGEDFHLNRIVGASGSRLYIAGEAGHLYRSDDAGTTWVELPSPYEGSFFGVLPLNGESLLAYGLRGHLFQSDDGGSTWREIKTGTQAMLNDAARLPGGGIVVAGLSGALLVSQDNGATYTLRQQSDRKGLSAVLPVGPTELVAAGEGGVKLIALKAGP